MKGERVFRNLSGHVACALSASGGRRRIAAEAAEEVYNFP